MYVVRTGGGQGPPYPTVISYHIIVGLEDLQCGVVSFGWYNLIENNILCTWTHEKMSTEMSYSWKYSIFRTMRSAVQPSFFESCNLKCFFYGDHVVHSVS